MDKLFITILNMSLTGSFVIIAICLARIPLKKAPKIISYCLWIVAGFRLVFPFSIKSTFSLIPFSAQVIPQDIAVQSMPHIDNGAASMNDMVNGVLSVATPAVSINPLQTWVTIGVYVWLTGVAVILFYGIVSYILLKRKMRMANRVDGNIFKIDNIQSPFVLGIVAPKIYIPLSLTASERDYIIFHERTHIRRHDHVIKFVAYSILCVHWFNPLVWGAFLLMVADMEMSCDECVLKEIGEDTKIAYSRLLLSLATEHRIIGGSPLAFGEGGVKERLKNILKFKKPSLAITIIAVALAVGLSVGCAVNRKNKTDLDIPDITAVETIDGAQAKALLFGYSWYDGKDSVVSDAIPTWQGEYSEGNTLVIDGEMGQNMIALSAEKPMTVSYLIYLPDGTVYDNGTRELYDSLSSRLYWTDNNTGIGIIAPFVPGEYIYEVTIEWEQNNLKATYGIKVVMTGIHSAYDEALSKIWNYYNDALSISLKGIETLPDAEYTGDCYVFEIELPDGRVQAAVSMEGALFIYGDGYWSAIKE